MIFNNTANPVVEEMARQAKVFTLLLGLTAILLSIGFLFGDTINNSNYSIMLELLNHKIWATIFCSYGILKLFQILNKLPHSLRIVTSMIGTWLWLYLFLSFVVFDIGNISPGELLIILPLACEAGELVLDIFNFRCSSSSQRNPSV